MARCLIALSLVVLLTSDCDAFGGRRRSRRNNVTYVHLIAENTVDVKVYGALKRRENVVESILKSRRKQP